MVFLLCPDTYNNAKLQVTDDSAKIGRLALNAIEKLNVYPGRRMYAVYTFSYDADTDTLSPMYVVTGQQANTILPYTEEAPGWEAMTALARRALLNMVGLLGGSNGDIRSVLPTVVEYSQKVGA